MDAIRLGKSGLKVSRLCLGCMSYGTPDWRPWVLDADTSLPFFKKALDSGINFFDTADVYSLGASEEVTGRALLGYARREDVVIASKVFNPMGPGPNDRGLSRKHVMDAIDATLRRLGTDHVDLYQIHRLDPETPMEETMEALHDVVKAGKARYIGASSMHAWEFVKMQYLADLHGWTRFVSMQPHYNLLYREEEREMFPYCAAEGVGVLPWSPLARGMLARARTERSVRATSDDIATALYGHESDDTIIERVAEVAARHGVKSSQIALAWLLRNPVVTAPIVGATKMHYLDDAIAALDVTLDDADVKRLEEGYTPHPPMNLTPRIKAPKERA